jgi:hypothetical protein
MSLVSVLGCGTWFFLIEEQLYYVDETTLGYAYGPGSGESALLPAAVAAANITRFASTAANVPLKTFSPASLAVQMPDDTVSKAAAPPGAEATAAFPQTVARLTIEPPSQATKYSVRVYVNCPYLTKDTPINDPHYVGSITFFGVEHSAHKGARTYTLPLGQTLRRLEEVGSPIGNQIQVQTLTIDNTGQVKTLDGTLAKVEIMQG